MYVKVAKRIWESEYKPSIQLLIDNGEISYRPAMILIFCAIEHAYRAIHEIPEKDACIEDAIHWALAISWLRNDEAKNEIPEGWQGFAAGLERSVTQIREMLFNPLKHVGHEHEGISIEDHDSASLSLGMTYLLVDGRKEFESQTVTLHIQQLWPQFVGQLDFEYSRAINDSIASHDIE